MLKPNVHAEYALQAGNPEVVVLVHGICASPVQFRPMAEFLFSQGFDCRALLLPGHGRGGGAFCRTEYGAWRDHVFSSIEEARKRYGRVFLVGHSLGGLLCLEYAASHAVDGLVLINAPLAFKLGLKQFSVILRVLLGRPGRDRELVAEYRRITGIFGGIRFHEVFLMPRPFLHLLRHMRQARKSLGGVTARTLIVQSGRDETVRQKSARMLETGLTGASVEELRLKNSYHCYFPPEEHRALFDAVLRFLKNA